ncbi:MAG: hypothetical protein ACJ701_05125 [Nitrososphaera sp.]
MERRFNDVMLEWERKNPDIVWRKESRTTRDTTTMEAAAAVQYHHRKRSSNNTIVFLYQWLCGDLSLAPLYFYYYYILCSFFEASWVRDMKTSITRVRYSVAITILRRSSN